MTVNEGEDKGGGDRARRPRFSRPVCAHDMDIVNRIFSQLHVDFHITAIFRDSRLRGQSCGMHLQQEKNYIHRSACGVCS